MVVPDHDLVGGVERIGSTTDDGEDVAAEEHLDQSDGAAWAEVAAEDLAEGVAVVDAEAEVGAGGEAAVVLVEGEVEELGRVWAGRSRGRVLGGGGGVGVVGFGVGGHYIGELEGRGGGGGGHWVIGKKWEMTSLGFVE